MPINTAIYGQRVEPNVGNALQAYAAIRQTRNADIANQLQQTQLGQMRDQIAGNNLLKMAYGANTNPDGTINYSGVSSYLAKNGGGDQIPGIAKQQRADAVDAANLAKLHAETDKATLEAHMGKLGAMARLAGSVTDQASYENAMKLAPQFGIDVSGMPAQYDPATIKQIRDASLSYADQLGQLWKQKEYDQKQQEITGNQALKKQDQNLRERDLALSQRKLDNDMLKDSPSYQASVAAAKEAATSAVKKDQDQQNKIQDSKAAIQLIDQMGKLVNRSSDGAVSKMFGTGLASVGIGSDTRIADRQLQVMGNQLALVAQRFPGVQTDKDYEHMLAQVGVLQDYNATREEKKAALAQAKADFQGIVKRYGGTLDDGSGGANGNAGHSYASAQEAYQDYKTARAAAYKAGDYATVRRMDAEALKDGLIKQPGAK